MSYELKVYEFNPGVDVAGALRAARALIRLPASHVEELRAVGFVPPAPTVVLDGIGYDAAEFAYELSSRGVLTQVRLGSEAPEASVFRTIRRRASEEAGDALALSRR